MIIALITTIASESQLFEYCIEYKTIEGKVQNGGGEKWGDLITDNCCYVNDRLLGIIYTFRF